MSEHPWIKRGPYPGPEHTGMPIPDDPIVGHATFRDGHHEPIRQSEAESIIAASDRAKALRAEQMPDERAAIEAMFSAWLRLKELGWSEAIYCPKDGSWFASIEAGSTGIHRTRYEGKWPDGTWWIEDGDLWPSRPCLWKPLAATEAATEVSSAPAASSAQKDSQPVWRPISTAPKDGREILVWWPHPVCSPVEISYYDSRFQWQSKRGGLHDTRQPTHWMPLPAPPQEPQP